MGFADSNSFTIGPLTTPQWFADLQELTRSEVAGGSGFSGSAFQKGATLASIQPSPYNWSNSWQKNSIIIPWCAACSDPANAIYIKAAEGGHGDGSDNGVYGLNLKQAVPAWQKLWGPTPIGQISSSPLGSGGSGSDNAFAHVANADGAPKTCHGWFRRVFGAGRIWLLMTNEGGGAWTSDVWSIPYASLGPAVVDASLWMYHGRIYTGTSGSGDLGGSFGFQSGPSAYDPVANKIMVAAEFAFGNGVVALDCAAMISAGNRPFTGPQCSGAQVFNVGMTGLGNAWSVVTDTNPRCWIVGSPSDNELRVWNLTSPNGFRTKTVSGGTVSGTAFCGAGYYKNSIIIGGPPSLTSSLRRITIPSDPWNASSGFNVSTLNLSGALSTVANFQGTFSQFQVIPDMGNGQGLAVVHCRDTSLPTYVIKLPAT